MKSIAIFGIKIDGRLPAFYFLNESKVDTDFEVSFAVDKEIEKTRDEGFIGAVVINPDGSGDLFPK